MTCKHSAIPTGIVTFTPPRYLCIFCEVERLNTRLAQLEPLVTARRTHNAAAAEIKSWLETEARDGNIRFNEDAPEWPAYERALEDWYAAVGALDAALTNGRL